MGPPAPDERLGRDEVFQHQCKGAAAEPPDPGRPLLRERKVVDLDPFVGSCHRTLFRDNEVTFGVERVGHVNDHGQLAFRKRYGTKDSNAHGTHAHAHGRYGCLVEGLAIKLFGPPHVLRGRIELRFDTRKAIALIAILAINGREQSRDHLAAMLWPGLDRQRSRAALRRTLSVATAAVPEIIVDGQAVRIDLAAAECDVVEFRRLVASEAPADWAAAAEHVRGDFLDGFVLRDSPAFEEWHFAVADELRNDASLCFALLVDHAVSRGDLPLALSAARRRIELDPLSEPAHVDLIRVTAWTGDRLGALQAYGELVKFLDGELGVSPLASRFDTHRLHFRPGNRAPHRRQRGFKRIVLLEREGGLLRRASYNNQARVHNGYHYPRSFTTAYRSRVNLPRFVADWPQAVKRDFTKLYAIARHNSKVTARQFERFCRDIGAQIRRADSAAHALFEPRLIEEVFQVQEYAFDATQLARWAVQELEECGVQVRLLTRATEIYQGADHTLQVVTDSEGGPQRLSCRYLFNCTYSGSNHFNGDFPGLDTDLRHEITEMALMQMPPALEGLGVTVMDGPFFSMMPFPSRDLHTLSHVRFTPHVQWDDDKSINPYDKLARHERSSRVERMVRDVGRYIPAILDSRHRDSLYEVKTVLAKNDRNDGRPILFEKHASLPGCYSVLGGKIDNIYDVLEKLDNEVF